MSKTGERGVLIALDAGALYIRAVVLSSLLLLRQCVCVKVISACLELILDSPDRFVYSIS